MNYKVWKDGDVVPKERNVSIRGTVEDAAEDFVASSERPLDDAIVHVQDENGTTWVVNVSVDSINYFTDIRGLVTEGGDVG